MSISKTRAIVLHHIKYGDSSIIVDMYTEEFGRMSFMVNGVMGRKSAIKIGLFQSLTLLELDIYLKSGRDLQRIREIKASLPLNELRMNLFKSTIGLFMAEILYKVLRESEKDAPLFHFLSKSIEFLDSQQGGISNFHVLFLLNLSRFLGFYPNSDESEVSAYFDLMEGRFVQRVPVHRHFLAGTSLQVFKSLLDHSMSELESLSLSSEERTQLLDSLLIYYQIHIPGMSTVKSLSVLQEVFNG